MFEIADMEWVRVCNKKQKCSYIKFSKKSCLYKAFFRLSNTPKPRVLGGGATHAQVVFAPKGWLTPRGAQRGSNLLNIVSKILQLSKFTKVL